MRDIENFRLKDGEKIDNLPNNTEDIITDILPGTNTSITRSGREVVINALGGSGTPLQGGYAYNSFITEEAQETLTLDYTYENTINPLLVFKDGVKLQLGTDYTQPTNQTVSLITPATAGEIYEVAYPGKGEKGDIGLTWRGEYNGATTYAINDAVSYNGSSYICILESTGNLPTDATYFDLIAQKGVDSGDMLKSTYDSNDDGVVNQADTITDQGDLATKNESELGLADKANDSEVVHLTGNETIADIKTFTSSPIVPTPTAGTEVANKEYVDNNAVSSVNGETGAVIITTGDITEDTNKKYVTDAQQVIIGNTSGINTGDETNSTIKSKYEANANTNAFTDTEKNKLDGIEDGAEVNTVDSVNGRTGVVTGLAEASDIPDNTDYVDLTTAQTIPGQKTFSMLTDNDLGTTGGTVAIDWANGLNQKITLNANTTFTFANPRQGHIHEILLTQDSTARTVTFPTITWQDGSAPDLSVASGEYLIQLTYRGTTYFGAAISFNA